MEDNVVHLYEPLMKSFKRINGGEDIGRILIGSCPTTRRIEDVVVEAAGCAIGSPEVGSAITCVRE